jgi:hypothetical protein
MQEETEMGGARRGGCHLQMLCLCGGGVLLLLLGASLGASNSESREQTALRRAAAAGRTPSTLFQHITPWKISIIIIYYNYQLPTNSTILGPGSLENINHHAACPRHQRLGSTPSSSSKSKSTFSFSSSSSSSSSSSTSWQ